MIEQMERYVNWYPFVCSTYLVYVTLTPLLLVCVSYKVYTHYFIYTDFTLLNAIKVYRKRVNMSQNLLT